MSQHRFDTTHADRPISIVMGWDRPLQGFFMFIRYRQEAADDVDAQDDNDDELCVADRDEFLYSNLSDTSDKLGRWTSMSADLGYFEGKLQSYGLQAPARMLAEVRADAQRNVGNRYCQYAADGQFIE